MKTYISYDTAKKLKEFLGENAPEPMYHEFYKPNGVGVYCTHIPRRSKEFPAYLLHDLLSKEFCEALAVKTGIHENEALLADQRLAVKLFWLWYTNGLPAVEKAFLEMMEVK